MFNNILTQKYWWANFCQNLCWRSYSASIMTKLTRWTSWHNKGDTCKRLNTSITYLWRECRAYVLTHVIALPTHVTRISYTFSSMTFVSFLSIETKFYKKTSKLNRVSKHIQVSKIRLIILPAVHSKRNWISRRSFEAVQCSRGFKRGFFHIIYVGIG